MQHCHESADRGCWGGRGSGVHALQSVPWEVVRRLVRSKRGRLASPAEIGVLLVACVAAAGGPILFGDPDKLGVVFVEPFVEPGRADDAANVPVRGSRVAVGLILPLV
eukprot:14738300-Heterocapsa_arctica.AAC.1